MEKLGKLKGSESLGKCIVTKVSPQELELLAGKKTKAWRKSIKNQEKPLSKYNAAGELLELRESELSPPPDASLPSISTLQTC